MKNGPGPVLLIRADMDALPVKEQTGLPFASKAMGKLPDGTDTPVMHACGHDTHITTWLGTARRLAAMKDQWSGTLVMILQPGEERVIGAQAMLDDGLFTRFPKPDVLLAFHDSATLPAGVIGVTRGFALANVDTRQHRRARRRRARRLSAEHQGPDRARRRASSWRCRLWSAAKTTRSNRPSSPSAASTPAPRTTSFPTTPSCADGAQLQPETRKLLLDGIAPHRARRGDRRRHARRQDADGRDRAAVGRRDLQHARAVRPSAATVRAAFRSGPRGRDQADHGGEDFSRFWLADKSNRA